MRWFNGSTPYRNPLSTEIYRFKSIFSRMEGFLMYRSIVLAIAFVGVLCLSAGSISASSPDGSVLTKKSVFVTDLIGGKHWDIGDVLVWHDTDNLYVKFELHIGWLRLVVSHVHVGLSMADFPYKNGNPAPGQFDYQVVHKRWEQEYTYSIPLDPSWVPGTDICIAAHCNIQGLCGLIESGWASGIDFPGSNWAMFFVYPM